MFKDKVRKLIVIIVACLFFVAAIIGLYTYFFAPPSDLQNSDDLYMHDTNNPYTSETSDLYTLFPDDLIFTEQTLSESSAISIGLYGNFATMRTDSALFLFSPELSNAEMANNIISAEIIFSVAQDVYNMEFLPRVGGNRVYFTTDSGATRITPNNRTYADVVISLDDSNRFGTLFSFMSGGNLPAWLCAGLELYWLSEYDFPVLQEVNSVDVHEWNNQLIENNMPAFGDVWFVPGFIDNSLSENALWVAYEFVKYLSEANQLSQLVALFMDDDSVWDAKTAFASAWSTFSGTPISADYNEGFLLRYQYNLSLGYGDPLRVGVENNVAQFSIRGRHALHHFTVADWWTIELALEYARNIENSIAFALDWVDLHNLNRTFTVIYHAVSNFGYLVEASSYLMRFNVGYDAEDSHYFPIVVEYIAELIHNTPEYAYAAFGFEQTRIIPSTTSGFEPAFSKLLRFLFLDELEDAHFNRVFLDYSMSMLDMFTEAFGHNYIDIYSERAIVADRLDARAFIDTSAIANFDRFIILLYPHLEYELPHMTRSEIYSYIGKYIGGMEPLDMSFFLFLLSQGTRDDFLRVYADITLIEEVYGRCIDTITSEWVVYLLG